MSFVFALHPEAEKSLNLRAEEIVGLLRPLSKQVPQPQGRESSASLMPAVTLDSSEVQNLRVTWVTQDLFGKTTSFYIETADGERIGLSEEDYAKYEALVQTAISRPELRDVMSEKFVSSVLMEWLRERRSGTLPATAGFVEFILSQASSRDVATWRVDVPIEYLVIEKPFALGDVTLHFYDRSFWDDLEQGLRKTKSDVEATQVLERLRRDFQGRVIASSTSKGDLRKCIEVATLRTELAVTVLRFFSPAAFLSPLTARFGMKGKVQLPTTLAWAWKEDWWTIEHFLEDLRSPNWGISQQYLEQLSNLGLDQASDLIRSKKHTPFEETLLASIATFGRAVANSDFHDKLIFCLSSAETLLLPETSEPVQTTLGLRLAFLSTKDPGRRAEIDQLVRQAY